MPPGDLAPSTATGPPVRRGPGRPRQDEAARDVRERLVAAARELFGSHGFGDTSIREITTRAGVSTGMVAYYFGDKTGLYEAVLDSVFGTLLGELRRLASTSPADEQPVGTFLRLYIRALSRAPWAPQLILREALTNSPTRESFMERYFGPLMSIAPAFIEREIDSKRLRSDLDPKLTLISLASLAVFPYLSHPLTGEAIGYDLDEDFRERLTSHVTRLFLDGTRPGAKCAS